MATMLASKTVFAARLSSVQAKRPTAPRAVLGAPAFLSGAALGPRQQTSHSMRARRAAVVVRAEEKATMDLSEGVEGGTDYSGILAVVGYAAVHFGKAHVDRGLLIKAFASYTLLNALVNLVTRRGFGEKVSHIIAPAVLAVYALNLSRISVMDTATLLFGYFLAEKLEPPSLFWGFIATLVAAVYYGYGTLWYAVAVALASATKMYRANEDGRALPVLLLAPIVASGWAIYKEQHVLWALLLFLCQTVWAAGRTGQRVLDHVSD
ncbi:g6630 [Coccomyxa viridis]|uniref:G6630 protein n=1 Tax=Coccomyxa viridis TaxID=1274662 RepID=A0ABP1FVU7_9CHLO